MIMKACIRVFWRREELFIIHQFGIVFGCQFIDVLSYAQRMCLHQAFLFSLIFSCQSIATVCIMIADPSLEVCVPRHLSRFWGRSAAVKVL